MTQPTCENCRWWNELWPKGIEPGGECRRMAPVRVETQTAWPETMRRNWCGEHQPKAEQPMPATPTTERPTQVL